MEIDCRVHFSAGAYVTNTVRGQRASSTCDAQSAAQRLGEKLLGAAFGDAKLMDTRHDDGRPHQVFKLVPKAGSEVVA